MVRIEIRKAESSDLHDIANIWRRNIKTMNTPSDIARLYHYFGKYFIIAVIHRGGQEQDTIGFVAGAVRDGHGHVSGIAVEREYRRKGIGGSLLRRLYEEFYNDGFERVTLEVRKSNKEAIRFYEAQGFKPVFVIHGYYADGEDAIVYEKRFTFRDANPVSHGKEGREDGS
ncbi:GNAT family N-acetyltransferase [Methanophagales archaeon]|nr:MAG: GNAT family N-acetyltransferase [Methanophagales archaeon]